MALFNRTKKNTEAKPQAKEGVVAAPAKVAARTATVGKSAFAYLLTAPRITEKAAIGTDHGVYVFNVDTRATKSMIAKAITELFKVTPRKIRVTAIPSVRVKTRQTQKDGYTRGGKKAYVYLKKGDKIEIA